MASAYLSRTHSSNPTNTTKATVSCWVKKASLANSQGIFGVRNTGNNHINVQCGFFNGKWYMWYKDGTNDQYLQDSYSIPRDVNGWYHVVFRFDTTDATTNNRMRVYVNGESLGVNFGSVDQPAQNDDIIIGTNGLEFSVGRYMFTGGTFQYFDGSITHFHYCDGYSYAPTEFGETDSTTGIWKPKTAPSVSYGNNGFFLKMDNSANMGLDSSGNSNNLTTSGTIIQNKDTPSNVFATLSPLQTGSASVSNAPLTNANNTFTSNEGSSVYPYYFSTLGVSSGKYYAEFKFVNAVSGTAGIGNGVADQYSGNNAYDYSYYYDGRLYNNGSGESTGYSAISNNDILGCALDLDNNKLYFHINGSYQASGNPATGAGGKSITAAASNGTGFYQFEVGDSGSTSPTTIQANFGNGYFGTTAVTSAQNPDDGIGIFEYDVPAGYRALCTKSINAEEYS